MKIANQMKKGSHVVLSISIGQEDQTGKNFDKMIDLLIENENIDEVTIFKADTLQRWNWKIEGFDDEGAEKKAKEVSLKWDEDNEEAIEKLKNAKKVNIKSWDDYRKDENGSDSKPFLEMLEKIKTNLNGNSGFRHNVTSLARNFLNKYKKNNEKNIKNFDEGKVLDFLNEYILEECAVLVLLSKQKEPVYNYELYFGKRNKPMVEAFEKFGNKNNMISNSILEDEREELIYHKKDKNMLFSNVVENKKKNIDVKPKAFSLELHGPGVNISIETPNAETLQEFFKLLGNSSLLKSMIIEDKDNDNKQGSLNKI